MTLFFQICFELDSLSSNWMKCWDNVTATPYAFKEDQFISYDDSTSITEKVLYIHLVNFCHEGDF